MRAIDAEKYMELLKEQYLHQKSVGNNQIAKAWQGAMQLLYDMPTLTPPNEWVSVEERLPKEKQRVIVRCERVGTSVGWILWGNWMADIGPDAGKVTHWMPLPAPPDRRPPEGEKDNNGT